MAKTLEEVLEEEKPEVVLRAFRRANEILRELEHGTAQQAEDCQASDSHQD